MDESNFLSQCMSISIKLYQLMGGASTTWGMYEYYTTTASLQMVKYDIYTSPCKKIRIILTDIYDAGDNLVCLFDEAEICICLRDNIKSVVFYHHK